MILTGKEIKIEITGFDKIKNVYYDSETALEEAAKTLGYSQIFKSNWFKHENEIHRMKEK
jgi:hypothetical protein